MPQVQRHVSKRVGRREGLFSLQEFERMAERGTADVPSFRQQTLEREPERTNILERGLKHSCSEYEIKYYDLKKEVAVYPKCRAKPTIARVLKSAPP